ncbi:type II secretion system F family protein [Jeongeupia naejangsanensis]|uniref:Type II secretion system F family protein n=1 Tax=Jeongeupia naejangsanensis TaxID=613195 RepID=A0ABS2BJS2_9NEIS|nr:type II secretion system F family protein [Jeongeupia naejangsanensis]MBM3115861.1 type II secretion system F family protein [Jeongeupia naejangsanensis]
MLSLLVLAAVLCLIGAGICLWIIARRERELQMRLARHARQDDPSLSHPSALARWQLWLLARRDELPRYWGIWLLLPLVASLVALRLLGGPAGAIAAAAMLALLAGLQAYRAARQRQRAVLQLPALLDGLARLASVGHSLPLAFGKVLDDTPQPLVAMLQRAQALHSAGIELDAALRQVAALYKISEFDLLAAAMKVAMHYGGQPEKLVNRIATVLQARQAAHEELLALTSEVRLSAWVLGIAPMAIGLVMGTLNQDYMSVLFRDPTGQRMLMVVLALQLAGAFFLYRLAKRV